MCQPVNVCVLGCLKQVRGQTLDLDLDSVFIEKAYYVQGRKPSVEQKRVLKKKQDPTCLPHFGCNLRDGDCPEDGPQRRKCLR